VSITAEGLAGIVNATAHGAEKKKELRATGIESQKEASTDETG
jgi:hypothetical protein